MFLFVVNSKAWNENEHGCGKIILRATIVVAMVVCARDYIHLLSLKMDIGENKWSKCFPTSEEK
jgi:hypothetical protein